VNSKPVRRPLFWEGSAKRDLKQFPDAVQKDIGVALFIVQLGRMPPSAKLWKGQGPGVYELIEGYRGDTFRAVYTVRIAKRIHVLHAFQKKSKTGIKTPREDVTLVESRLKAVLVRHRKERNR
jgi:phage-related protein